MMTPCLAAAVQIASLQAGLAEARDQLEALIEGLPALRSYADRAAIGAAVQVRTEILGVMAEATAPGYGAVTEAHARRARLAVLPGGAS